MAIYNIRRIYICRIVPSNIIITNKSYCTLYYRNDWSKFAPKTNAYWLHYIVNKMAIKSRVKNVTKRQIQNALTPLITKFPEYDSAKEIFLELFSRPSPLRDRKIVKT